MATDHGNSMPVDHRTESSSRATLAECGGDFTGLARPGRNGPLGPTYTVSEESKTKEYIYEEDGSLGGATNVTPSLEWNL
jgi:hypothetical protein